MICSLVGQLLRWFVHVATVMTLEDWMVGVCGMYGETWRKETALKTDHWWDDNIKIGLEQMWWQGLDSNGLC